MSRLWFLLPLSNVRLEHDQYTSHPAESTVNLFLGSFEAKMPSASGDRQIFPKHTIKIFTDMMRLALVFYGYLQQIS
jgi:hypothetical protein